MEVIYHVRACPLIAVCLAANDNFFWERIHVIIPSAGSDILTENLIFDRQLSISKKSFADAFSKTIIHRREWVKAK